MISVLVMNSSLNSHQLYLVKINLEEKKFAKIKKINVNHLQGTKSKFEPDTSF